MTGKYFLVDTSRCTACRGCQVACKAWNKLPATHTRQRGTNQNPPDLNADTWRLVRFHEYPNPVNRTTWYFFSDACRHCLEPPCLEAANQLKKGAGFVHKSGAVLYGKDSFSRDEFRKIREACPYDIPRHQADSGRIVKCNMCVERVEAGLLPACAKACPTGAIVFGDRAEIRELADRRLAAAGKKYGDAVQLLTWEEVRVWFLVVDDADKYSKTA